MAVLVINGGEIPHEGELVASLKAAGAVSVILNENRERTNVIMGRHFHTLYGYDTLTDELCGLRFEISRRRSFKLIRRRRKCCTRRRWICRADGRRAPMRRVLRRGHDYADDGAPLPGSAGHRDCSAGD